MNGSELLVLIAQRHEAGHHSWKDAPANIRYNYVALVMDEKMTTLGEFWGDTIDDVESLCREMPFELSTRFVAFGS